MKKMILCLILAGSLFQKLGAQEIFIPYGKISFEKRINVQRSTQELNLSDQAREKLGRYRISKWELYFDQDKSVYKNLRKETENDNPLFFLSISEPDNQQYTDYRSKSRILKKNIMGEDYLLKDSIPAVQWKILHDLRSIAGYECRKAVGIINDSVYVVAFYTEEILLKGGPEGFSGLPGMILGLAIPRYNTTWFATAVSGFSNYTEQLVPPQKGKRTDTDKEMQKLLETYSRYRGNGKEKPEDVRRQLLGFVL